MAVRTGLFTSACSTIAGSRSTLTVAAASCPGPVVGADGFWFIGAAVWRSVTDVVEFSLDFFSPCVVS